MVNPVAEKAAPLHSTTGSRKLSQPGPILLLGAPGAGKGTQAKILMAEWSVPQISTGDLLREMRRDPEKSSSPLGQQIRTVMDSGRLVPDDLVQALVAHRVEQPDAVRGYILDGFPRTLPQAEWLDGYVAARPQSLPVVAVNIQVSYTELLRRITGRRTCPACARIYNMYFHPPRHNETCDVDGARLVQRADDVEDVFSERMRTYDASTAPVIAHYRALGQFAEVDGELSVAEVSAALSDAIVRLRGF